MQKNPSRDAFIAPFLEKQQIDETDPKLKERFIEEYRPELEIMWHDFLLDQAVALIAQEHPLLMTKLEDTPLSTRAKNVLREIDVKTVADISVYSLPELIVFRDMGKKTLQEISDYMKEVLG